MGTASRKFRLSLTFSGYGIGKGLKDRHWSGTVIGGERVS